MKRIFMLCLGASLAISSAALAAPGDQNNSDRPRRIQPFTRGYLGVDLGEVTAEVAGRLRLREERGALVTAVASDAAAAKAGLQKDDVIIKWNGEAVESARELERRIRETPAGRNVKLGVLRNGGETEVTAKLGDARDHIRTVLTPRVAVAPRAPMVTKPITAARVRVREGYVGMSLQSMSPQLAEYFGLHNRNGALVTFVHPDSAAAKAGLKAGDVILSIGGETVDSPVRVATALRGRGEGAVEVKVMRDRQERTLTVQLEKGKTSLVWPDEGADVITAEALVEPFEFGPLNIEPLHIEPMTIAPLRLAPMALPRIHIAPMPPMVVPEMRLAPMSLPRMTLPKISIPKVTIPPMRIVMPNMVFRIEV